jgi:hypothetical protein
MESEMDATAAAPIFTVRFLQPSLLPGKPDSKTLSGTKSFPTRSPTFDPTGKARSRFMLTTEISNCYSGG